MDSANATTAEGPAARDWALAASALAVPVGLLFFRVLFLDAALHGRDVLHHYWPLHEAVRRTLIEGRLPAWDAGVQGGVPLLANLHAGVFYPPNLAYLLLPFPRAYAWLLAAHLVVLGLGAYGLARRFYGQAPAVGGALALVLSGPVISLNVYGPFLSSLAWTPWALWALVSPWRWTARAAAVGALLALQVLGGDPQPALFTALLGALALALLERSRAGLLAALGGAALGAALAAVQALPSLELLAHSARGAGLQPDAWSLHPARAAELFLPSAFGQYLERPGFWGNFLSSGPVQIPFLLSVYGGAAAAAVALLPSPRAPPARFGLCAAGLGLFLALGARFWAGPLLAHVPPFSFFRYPEKYLVLAALGFSLVVASGIAALAQSARPWRALPPVALALLALALAGPLDGLLEALARPAITRPGGRFPFEMVTASVGASGLHALAFAVAALLVVVLAARAVPPARAAWLMVGVVAADLASAAGPMVWTGPTELYTERPALAAVLPALSSQAPFRLFRDNARLERVAQTEGTYLGMAERRAFDVLTLKSAIGTVWGLEDLGSSSPVSLARQAALARALSSQPTRAYALYNACVAIAPAAGPLQGTPGATLARELARGVGVFTIAGCAPRLGFAQTVQAAQGLDEALAKVAATDFVPGRDAVVEGPWGGPAHSAARVTAARYEPSGRAVAAVDAPEGGLLVYAMGWFPGWGARADGRQLEARVVNGALVGVEVPPGAREVVFEFFPRALWPGAALSLAGVGALLTVAALGRLSRLVSRRRG